MRVRFKITIRITNLRVKNSVSLYKSIFFLSRSDDSLKTQQRRVVFIVSPAWWAVGKIIFRLTNFITKIQNSTGSCPSPLFMDTDFVAPPLPMVFCNFFQLLKRWRTAQVKYISQSLINSLSTGISSRIQSMIRHNVKSAGKGHDLYFLFITRKISAPSYLQQLSRRDCIGPPESS